MLRDFALGAARNFSSDVDLVAEASSSDIERAVRDFSPTRNKFGGFRFASGKWRFDIWAFEDTWAFKQGLVNGRELTDLFRTTFFNLDAVLYHLGQRRLYFSPEYEAGILNRLLEVNLSVNPAPARMVRRSIQLVLARELSVGPRLAQFIVHNESVYSSDGIYASFIRDLRHHVQHGPESAYRYRPQSRMDIGVQ
jgi:hypothetical protein